MGRGLRESDPKAVIRRVPFLKYSLTAVKPGFYLIRDELITIHFPS